MLQGTHITLRPMEKSDLPRLWEFAQDLDLGLLTGADGRPISHAVVDVTFEGTLPAIASTRNGGPGGMSMPFAGPSMPMASSSAGSSWRPFTGGTGRQNWPYGSATLFRAAAALDSMPCSWPWPTHFVPWACTV